MELVFYSGNAWMTTPMNECGIVRCGTSPPVVPASDISPSQPLYVNVKYGEIYS